MTTQIGDNTSVWMATAEMPSCSSLNQDQQADVCIIGAGIAGLTTAYLLSESGKSVIVLDDGPLASGMTQWTTAHLTNAIDDRYVEIERIHGQAGARLAAQSHTAAIDKIESIVQKELINCNFQRLDGFLFVPPGEKLQVLDRELEAAHRAGLFDVEKLVRVPLNSFDFGPCLRFRNQGQFHPLKYLAGLTTAIERKGGRLFTQSHVDRIEGGRPARVTVGNHTITANAVVVATNTPINDLVAIHTKQAGYTTYVIGTRVPRGSIAMGLYWDTQDPYHYLRLCVDDTAGISGQFDSLIVGGEDHKSGQADDTQERHDRLERWARQRFPMMGPIEYRWAGQVMETIDGLAFIGRNPFDADNVFIATGDSGQGMTHGTIAGMLLTDLILGHDNEWADLYSPSRKSLRALERFAKEAWNVAVQYADWVTPGDVSSVEEIHNNCGAVLRRGLTKVAVYRDELGSIHECSAVCPHLGCIVAWNEADKSWDCPCHGSRFDKFGECINGPANRNLEVVGQLATQEPAHTR